LYVSEAWLNRTYDSVLYQIALRSLYELFQADAAAAIDSIVFNGWVNSIDKATGKEVNACILSIQATKSEFMDINLAHNFGNLASLPRQLCSKTFDSAGKIQVCR
jgi:restriction system protein